MRLVEFYLNSFTNDTHFMISDEDYEEISNHKWRLSSPDQCGNMYVVKANDKGDRLHRIILNVTDTKIRVDHKNMNTLDNTRENLRTCTPSQNAANKKVQNNKKSGRFKGVFKRGNKFRAMIGFNNKLIHLGTFSSDKEAAEAYNKKAIELFKEFAQLNIIT